MIPVRLSLMLGIARVLQHGQEFRKYGPQGAPLTENRFVEGFKSIREDLEELGLVSSLDQTERIIEKLNNGAVSAHEYAEMLQALLDRLMDETARRQFFMIPVHKVQYYSGARDCFGENVNKAFGSAQNDIERAAKCYAFGANTAVVFHLMRVMETGLRALGKSLHDDSLDPQKNPTWENILRRCDEELRKPLKDRSPDWSASGQFYCDATANLRAVKDAWRNSTMHIDRDYDEDESLNILNAVRGFMQKLAERLSE